MRIYKPGDKVRVVASTYSPNKDTRALIGKVGEIKRYDDGDNAYAVYDPDKPDWWWFSASDLAPAAPSWDSISEGDVLVKDSIHYDLTLIVQGTIGKIVFAVDSDNNVMCRTISDLKDSGWRIKDAEPDDITEVTLSEVADKLGIPVEKLRIKD